MALAVVGQKRGMTRVFTDDGRSLPVTVIEVQPNRVTQVKDQDTDGYRAVQVTHGDKSAGKLSKAEAGHFAKANQAPGASLMEVRLGDDDETFEVGGEIKADIFEEGQRVDVTGISKGKGFAGVVKRHNFRTQDATHGNSLAHRAPGSIGQCQTPGRVFKGKKMAGHMGNVKRTTQNLEVVRVDVERSLLLIRGAVPGAPGGEVIVRPSVKQTKGD